MAKIKASTIIKNVTIFKDSNFSKPFDGFFDKFDVEFIKDKARVICNSRYVDSPSRLNKLHMVGSWTGGGSPSRYGYTLIVNGIQVYFIVEDYNIGNIANWSDKRIENIFFHCEGDFDALKVRNHCMTIEDKRNFLIKHGDFI